jgi:hypothetical protein
VPISSKPWNAVPKEPGIYAMYGGLPPRTWVAYVGQAGNVAQRLAQHLDRRSSSVATGTSAVGLNVDYIAPAYPVLSGSRSSLRAWGDWTSR